MERFRVITFRNEELIAAGCPTREKLGYLHNEPFEHYDNSLWYFNEPWEPRLIFIDGGEPEDQTLRRDWAFIISELNKLDKENQELRAYIKDLTNNGGLE